VVAIGNPLGQLGGTVTDGIISALDREITFDGVTMVLLQTNAAVNPGNSGGGLFNAKGELIGIVNAKSVGENVEGLGFAIPISDAIRIMTDLVEKGYVSGRVKLGFELFEIQSQEDIRRWFKYSRYFTDYGVYIASSESNSFHEGDLLVAINSVKIASLSDLKALLQDFNVGQTVTVTVSRIVGNKVQIFDYQLTLTEKK
jgi:serine protease Do